MKISAERNCLRLFVLTNLGLESFMMIVKLQLLSKSDEVMLGVTREMMILL